MLNSRLFIFYLMILIFEIQDTSTKELLKESETDSDFELDPYIPISDFPVERRKRDTYNRVEGYPYAAYRPNEPTYLGKLFFEKIKKVAKVIDKKAKFFMKKFPADSSYHEENPFTGGSYPWATPSQSYSYYESSSDHDSYYTRYPETEVSYSRPSSYPSSSIHPSSNESPKHSSNTGKTYTSYSSRHPSVHSSKPVQEPFVTSSTATISTSYSSPSQTTSYSSPSQTTSYSSPSSSSSDKTPSSTSYSVSSSTILDTKDVPTFSSNYELPTVSTIENFDVPEKNLHILESQDKNATSTINVQVDNQAQDIFEKIPITSSSIDLNEALPQKPDSGVILWPEDLAKLWRRSNVTTTGEQDEGSTMENMISKIFSENIEASYSEDIDSDDETAMENMLVDIFNVEMKDIDNKIQDYNKGDVKIKQPKTSKPPMKFFPSNQEVAADDFKSVMEDVDSLMQVALDTTSSVDALTEAISAVSDDMDKLESQFTNFGQQQIKMKNVITNFHNVVEAKSSSSISLEDYMDAMKIIKQDLEDLQNVKNEQQQVFSKDEAANVVVTPGISSNVQIIPLNESPKAPSLTGNELRFFGKTEFLNPKFQTDSVRAYVGDQDSLSTGQKANTIGSKGVGGLAYIVRDKKDPSRQFLIPAHVIENFNNNL